MIPITEIHPMLVHFPIVFWISAEVIAVITLSIFGLHAVLRLLAFWRHYSLAGIRGWLAEVPGLVGIGGMRVTAYLGGVLVYHLGVNVAAVVH